MAMEERMPLNLDPSMMQTGQVKKRGGMFGGNAGNFISNMILNYAAMQGNQGAVSVLQSLNERRLAEAKQKYEEDQYQRHRGDELSDYGKKLQLQSQYKSHEPTDFQQYATEGGYIPGTPEYAALMKRKADAMANPIVMTPYGPMPYSAVNGGGQQAPAKPLTDEDILRMQGGPTPQASGGCPRPY